MEIDLRSAMRRRLVCDHASFKLMTAIAERDAAILERNTAVVERKAANSERDAALERCKIAYAERDSAILERDAAVAALGVARVGKIAVFDDWDKFPSAGTVRSKQSRLSSVSEICPRVGDCQLVPPYELKSQLGRCILVSDPLQTAELLGDSEEVCRELRSKRKSAENGPCRSTVLKTAAKIAAGQKLQEQNDVSPFSREDGHSAVPYCSCTGVNQPCYRWGNGGWQSACCTTMISMYPLPMNPKKRSSRLAGRKMSAGAFEKLLEKLIFEGVNVKCPIDLKDHWAKHGTNRYVTLR